MKEQFASRDDELKAVRRENRKRRKMIESYQEMMNAGATGLHSVSLYASFSHFLAPPSLVSSLQEGICQC